MSQRIIGEGATKLMDSINNPPAPFHIAYAGQENINAKFPREAGSKLELGPVEMNADISSDQIAVTGNQGSKKTDLKAKKDDQIGWGMAQLEVMGPLMSANISLAFGGIGAHSAGSGNVGSSAADKYEMDTESASATNKMAFDMASGLLGGNIKIESVKGDVWVERSTGRVVKFNFDSGLSDKGGNTWKEHHEMVVTPR